MTATPPPRPPLARAWNPADDPRYRPQTADTSIGWDGRFTAACPDCGQLIGWTDSKTTGPVPGPCDTCDENEAAA